MKKITQNTVAELLGISAAFLSQILSGKRRPAPKLALRFQKITSIPLETWLFGTPAEIKEMVAEYVQRLMADVK